MTPEVVHVSAGLKHAKTKGVRIGRPRRVFDRQRALDMRTRELGVGQGTVVRAING